MAKRDRKRKNNKYIEPKISELEKWLKSFRHAHGHESLVREIKSITGNPKQKKESPKTKHKKETTSQEPKISDIEKMFRIFREEHGHKKLEESVGEATKKNAKKQETNIHQGEKHIVYNDRLPKENPVDKKNNRNTWKRIVLSLSFLKNKLKYRRYRYPVIAMGIFLGLYLLFNLPLIYTRVSWNKSTDTQKLIVKTQEVVQKKMADSAPLAPGEVIPAESRLIIPKINVNVPIFFANTTDEKTIENLLRNGVVHYQGTANPGEVGNSFITGHSSNYWWDTGKYNYVFVLLDKLEPGDQAVVYHDGKKFIYTVRNKVVVEANDMSVLNQTDTPVLSLMTCTPPGTSWKRLVVKFDRTDPVYYRPETVTKEKVVETPRQEEKKRSFLSNILSFFIPN